MDINTRQFFDMLRESEVNPTTSQPTPRDFLAVFEQFNQKGEEVVYIGVSSALSGTLQSARIAADMSGYDKIYIVDSLSATLGVEILVRYACKLRDMGKNGAQVARAVEEKSTQRQTDCCGGYIEISGARRTHFQSRRCDRRRSGHKTFGEHCGRQS